MIGDASGTPSARPTRGLDAWRLSRRLVGVLDAPWEEARAALVEVLGALLHHAVDDSVGPLERIARLVQRLDDLEARLNEKVRG